MKDMKSAYPGAIEVIPHNAPIPRGKSILMSCFVDANYTSDKITRRSQSGIIIYCNTAPIRKDKILSNHQYSEVGV